MLEKFNLIENKVIAELKILMRQSALANAFDREAWSRELQPLVQLWSRVNNVCILSFKCFGVDKSAAEPRYVGATPGRSR